MRDRIDRIALLALAAASMRRSRLLNGPAPVLVLVTAAAVAGCLRGGFKDLFVYVYEAGRCSTVSRSTSPETR